MISFVIDASALVELATSSEPNAELRRIALTGSGGAPELIDLEAVQTVRGLVRRGALSDPEGREVVASVRDSPIARLAHRPLLGRVWELRSSITAYDASYVALAEQLDVPLLTCDGHLARAHGHRARIQLFVRT